MLPVDNPGTNSIIGNQFIVIHKILFIYLCKDNQCKIINKKYIYFFNTYIYDISVKLKIIHNHSQCLYSYMNSLSVLCNFSYGLRIIILF